MMHILGSIFGALEKGLSIYDRKMQRKYIEEYREIIQGISSELSKPVVRNASFKDVKQLRDSNKLDHLYLRLKILCDKFLKDEDVK